MAELDDQTKLSRKENRARIRAQQDLGDLGFVMSDPAGRRFINALLEDCGIMKMSMGQLGPGMDGVAAAMQSCFYEGQRNIGNRLFSKITKNFKNEWLLMNDEANTEENKHG